MSLHRHKAFIAGEWLGEPDLAVLNPATGEVVGHVPNFGAAEATRAVEAAHEAFLLWRAMLAAERAQVLKRWSALVLANREELAALITAEQGKPLAEAGAEIGHAAAFIEYFAEEARRIYGETIPAPRADARLMVIRQPAGVVAAITPWNFPAAMITRKVAPALAAGCAVVCKPAPETPLTALALASLAEEAGMPRGVFSVITGDAAAIGGVFTAHPLVRVLAFTGSTEVGRLLMAQSAPTIKRLALELGGNAPFIIFEDAEIERAVEGVLQSKFRNNGQTCVCANRIYVQSAIYDQVADMMAEKMAGMKVGPGTEPGVTLGPLICEHAVEKVEAHIRDAVEKGASLRFGGRRHALGRTFFEPTLITGVQPDMRISREETFGPVAGLIRFETEAEVIRLANDTQYGLAAYFYARDIGRITRVYEALEYGVVGVNTGTFSTELAPFGGVKESGIGREGSRHGMDEFLDMKCVMLAGIGS